MRKPALLIAAALVMLCTSAAMAVGADGAASVKLIEPIRVPDTKAVTGMFDNLGPDALAAGLGEARLHADVNQQSLGGDRTRVSVTWHSISKTDGTHTATRPLQPPLTSQVVTSDLEITPTTAMTARGDLAQVMRTYEAVLAELDAKARESVVNNNSSTTNNTTNNNNADDAADRSTQQGLPLGGTAGGGIGAPESPTSEDSGSGDDLGSPSKGEDRTGPDSARAVWEPCTPRIDRTRGLVFARAKEVVKNSSGAVVSEKECTDTGETAEIKRDYEAGCDKMIDYDRRKAYPRYTTYAQLGGERIEVDSCTVDMDKGIDVLASFEGCSVRHDFPAKRSVQQQFLYYIEGGKQVPVSECLDSEESYEHFLTTTTCTPTVDQANGHVWINKRVAYTKPDGTVEFASDCKPQSDSSVPIKTEICADKWEHDFNVGQSYVRSREFYVDDKGVKQYISACSRDTTKAYEHKYTTDGCNVVNDDKNLQTRWYSKTYIDTESGRLEIAACKERNNPTPYVFLGSPTETQSAKYLGSAVRNTTVDSLVKKKWTPNWSKDSLQIIESGNCQGSIKKPHSSSSIIYGQCWVSENWYYADITVTRKQNFREYRRGDGSIYKILDSTAYIIEVK